MSRVKLATHIVGINCELPDFAVTKRIFRLKKIMARDFGNVHTSSPHFTLNINPIDPTNFDLLVQELSKGTNESITIELRDIFYNLKDNFIAIEIARAKEVVNLSNNIVRICDKIRGNLLRSKDYSKLKAKEFLKIEAKLTKKHGYQRVEELYFPHISLGYIETPSRKLLDFFDLLHIESIKIRGTKIPIKKFKVEMFDATEKPGAGTPLRSAEIKLSNHPSFLPPSQQT